MTRPAAGQINMHHHAASQLPKPPTTTAISGGPSSMPNRGALHHEAVGHRHELGLGRVRRGAAIGGRRQHAAAGA